MFSLLTYLTCCAKEGIHVNFVDSEYADFDITYVKRQKVVDRYGYYTYKYNTYSTTYCNRGWFVVFREYKNGKPGALHFVPGADKGVADYDDIHFVTITSIDPVTGYIILCFNITNNGDEPKRLDVGVFADIDLAGNDKASVIPLANRRGFTMKDPNTQISFTLLVKDASGTTNVDAFYYGPFEDGWAHIGYDDYGNEAVLYYPEKLPYFRNLSSTTVLQNQDSVFSFSWQKRDIYPGKTMSYGTTAGTGANLKSPPFAKWTCDFKDNYNANEQVTVTFSIGDYDKGENIYIYRQDNDISEFFQYFYVTDSPTVNTYSITINLGTSPTYNLSIYAIDDNNWESNILEKTFYVTSKPTITVTNSIDSTYMSNSLIHVEGYVNDQTSVNIGYRFDDSFTFYDDTSYACFGYDLKYSVYIPIDPTLQSGTHTLYVFAQNSYGIQSDAISMTFNLVISTAPSIKNVKASKYFAQPGEKINLSGVFKDDDPNDEITFYVQFGSGQFTNLGKLAANGKWQPFNFSYTIPKVKVFKDYTVTINGKDKQGNPSNDAYVTINVNLPSSTPQNTPISTPISTPYITAQQTAASTPQFTPLSTAFQTPFSTVQNTPFSTALQTPAFTAERTESATAYETPFETLFQTAAETQFETAFQTPELTVQETFHQTAEATAFETPFETVYQTVSSTPFETVLETPFETAFNTIEETPFSTPHMSKFGTPFITPFETNAQTLHETPFNTAFETPYQTSSETPFETSFETPFISPYKTPENTPGSTFDQTPFETAIETVYQTPFTTPANTPVNTPYETAAETQKETPLNTQDETPFVTFQPTPLETQQETPYETVQQTAAETNSATAVETPFSTPVNSQVPTVTPDDDNHSLIYNSQSSIMQDSSSLVNHKSKNTILIVVICCCVLVAIIAAAIIAAIMIHKKKGSDSDEEESAVEMEETVITPQVASDTITLDNPLFTTSINESEDIFANEFEESNPVRYFFAEGNE